VAQNVALIRSIPEQYLERVGAKVRDAVATGRRAATWPRTSRPSTA